MMARPTSIQEARAVDLFASLALDVGIRDAESIFIEVLKRAAIAQIGVADDVDGFEKIAHLAFIGIATHFGGGGDALRKGRALAAWVFHNLADTPAERHEKLQRREVKTARLRAAYDRYVVELRVPKWQLACRMGKKNSLEVERIHQRFKRFQAEDKARAKRLAKPKRR